MRKHYFILLTNLLYIIKLLNFFYLGRDLPKFDCCLPSTFMYHSPKLWI